MGAERKSWAGLALLGLIFAAGGCADEASRAQPSPTTSGITVTVQAAGETTSPRAASTASPPADAGGDPTEVDSQTTTSSNPATAPQTIDLHVPNGAYAVIWVRQGSRIELRSDPGGGSVVDTVGRRTEFGSPTVFGVVRQVGDWAGVTTSKLPNGHLAWVRLDPRRLNAGWTRMSIVVDLSARRAELEDGDRVVRAFPVTVGAPGVDTPTGRFSVTDTFRGGLDQAAYGCCALALSATQPHLPTGWLGGNRIAIHGTTGPLGVAASHGCVRAADHDVSALVDKVPLGTPVFIRS
jgi:lipoprotein-anchoring transpeptidase ErfK/SrfK